MSEWETMRLLPDEARALRQFELEFRLKLSAAKRSGALSGEEHPRMVATAVLRITGEDCRLLSKEGKALLTNLRCFI